MRVKREWDLRDYLVVILGLLGTLFFILLFWLDLNQAFARFSDEPVGSITGKYRVAQRRFADQGLWSRLQEGSPIYNGDFIRTAAESEATIQFLDGVRLDIGENCLVQIFATDASPRIHLTQGSMSVDASASTKDVALMMGARDQGVRIAGGAVLDARLSENENFNLRLSEGHADFDRNGTIRSLTSGEVLSIDALGAILVEARTVMVSPRPGLRLFLRDGPGGASVPVDFVWKGVLYAPGERTRLEIAADRNFKRIAHTRNGGTDGETRISLAPGVWFWRAYPVSAEGTATEATVANAAIGRVTVNTAPVFRGLNPQEGDRYRYRNRPPDIRYQWTSSAEVAHYVVEVADNPRFENPVIQTTVRGGSGETGSLTDSSLGQGRWYWRVRPILGSEYQDTLAPSAPLSFTITQGGELPAPTLVSPPAGFPINTLKTAEVNFSWQNEAEAVSYTLLVSASPDLQNPVITRRVEVNYYRHSGLPEGRYYWGVYQSAADGTVSAISPSRSFTLMAGELGALFPPDNYTMPQGPLPEFTWKTDLPYPLRFQVSDTPWFTRLRVDRSVAGGSFRPPALEAGQWYWRISAQTEGGNVQTEARSFQVVPDLAPPPITDLPGEGGPGQTRRVLVNRGVPTAFTWQSVPGADYYTFNLYAGNSPRGNPVYSASTVPGTRLEASLEQFPEGRYTWTVTAAAEETLRSARRTGTAGSARFELRKAPVPLLPEPAQRRPANGYVLGPDQLKVSRRITFTWNVVPGANRYTFTLYRETGNNRTLIRRQESAPQTSYTLDDAGILENGRFVWQVEALRIADDGYLEQRGTPGENRFTLNVPVPERYTPPEPGILYGE
ncbi:hypothetical protein AGMMS49942_11940 [Spirochaetia bacterium]|nr:hypothetical protein AGMMS49942_11940 [Spirochaetia bacterium]